MTVGAPVCEEVAKLVKSLNRYIQDGSTDIINLMMCWLNTLATFHHEFCLALYRGSVVCCGNVFAV